MRPKTSESEEHQLELGAVLLESFINMKDELIILGKVIDWKHFGEKFGESFHERQGRPGLPTRLMVGLTYLKYLHNLSDEKVGKAVSAKSLLAILLWICLLSEKSIFRGIQSDKI